MKGAVAAGRSNSHRCGASKALPRSTFAGRPWAAALRARIGLDEQAGDHQPVLIAEFGLQVFCFGLHPGPRTQAVVLGISLIVLGNVLTTISFD